MKRNLFNIGAKNTVLIVLIFLTFLTFLPIVKLEVFTSLAKTESLLETEAYVIKTLKTYLKREAKGVLKKIKIKRYLAECEEEHAIAMRNITHYIGNPINAFRLVKRLSRDLNYEVFQEYNKLYSRSGKGKIYPTIEDLKGASMGILQLVFVYRLDVTDVADGIITSSSSVSEENFFEYVNPMSATDCFEIGLTARDSNMLSMSIAWMIEALNKYFDCKYCPFTDTQVVEHISQMYSKKGDVEKSLIWKKRSMNLELSFDHMEKYKRLIKHWIFLERYNRTMKVFAKESEVNNFEKAQSNDTYTIEGAPCVEETSVSVNNKSLHCYYKHGPKPFLKLAPFKMEELYLNPDILMIHNVVNTKEAEIIKLLAKPKLTPGELGDKTELSPNNYRVLQVAWLKDKSSKVVAKVTNRIAQFTDLSMENVENLQVANYGIGGYSSTHYDCKHHSTNMTKVLKGRRIATVMIFLSDVIQGGATVFYQLGLNVFPKKNAAIFWRNVLPSGYLNQRSVHAACPVLRGYKWVATKWISAPWAPKPLYGGNHKAHLRK